MRAVKFAPFPANGFIWCAAPPTEACQAELGEISPCPHEVKHLVLSRRPC